MAEAEGVVWVRLVDCQLRQEILAPPPSMKESAGKAERSLVHLEEVAQPLAVILVVRAVAVLRFQVGLAVLEWEKIPVAAHHLASAKAPRAMGPVLLRTWRQARLEPVLAVVQVVVQQLPEAEFFSSFRSIDHYENVAQRYRVHQDQ